MASDDPYRVVLTGGSMSGKTSVANRFGMEGYSVVPEVAEAYVDQAASEGIDGEAAQRYGGAGPIVLKDIEAEGNFSKEDRVVLDRSVGDSLYFAKKFHDLGPDLEILESYSSDDNLLDYVEENAGFSGEELLHMDSENMAYLDQPDGKFSEDEILFMTVLDYAMDAYDEVFHLEQVEGEVGFEQDGTRTENRELAREIHDELADWYGDVLNLEVTEVPADDVQSRTELIAEESDLEAASSMDTSWF